MKEFSETPLRLFAQSVSGNPSCELRFAFHLTAVHREDECKREPVLDIVVETQAAGR
jgi:hypothetical protein